MGIVATNARRIMREKCLKQSLIARRAGFGVKEFNNFLSDRKIIREEHVLPIADALEVSPNDLFATDYKETG